MPYSVIPYKNGYRVCLTSNTERCFSKRPLSRRTAERQRVAIERSEQSPADSAFEKQLVSIGFPPTLYLEWARRQATLTGYNPLTLGFSDKPGYKLVITSPSGKRTYFGRTGYNDYLIYLFLEASGRVPQGTAGRMRRNYHGRASKARGDWRRSAYSPNCLALCINW